MNVSSLTSSSSSSASNTAYGSSGLSGLMSGMDTETMVKQMLSGTQTKIDSANQKKQQTTWKQDSYRTCITDINTLYQSYFNASYDADATNNLASSKFFSQKASAVSGSGVKIISTDSSATTGDMSVAVRRLATKASMTSTQMMSGDRTITGTSATSLDAFNKTVSLKINDTSVTVNLNSATTNDEVVQAFNDAMKEKGVTGVTAKVYNGRLRLVTDDANTTLSVDRDNSTSYGLSVSGLGNTSNSDLQDTAGTTTGSMLQGVAMSATDGPSIQVSLDGVTKNISLNDVAGENGEITLESMKDSLNRELRTAFGTFVNVQLTGSGSDQKLQFYMDDGDSTTSDDGKGHELKIYGADVQNLGITPGTSSCISTSTKLGDLNGISGSSYAFTINGQSFSFNENNTLSDVISKINNSGAGVKISYSSLSDTFSMASTSTGAQYGIEISQTKGNLMSAIFGSSVDAANTTVSNELTTGSIATDGLAEEYSTKAATLSMKVNGTSYKYSLTAKADGSAYTKQEIEDGFNTWLKDTFGTGVDGTANISYADSDDGSGKQLKIADGFAVSFDASSVDMEDASALATAKTSDLALAMGFNTKATSNTATTEETKLSEITQLSQYFEQDRNAAAGDEKIFGLANSVSLENATLADITSINGVAVQYAGGRFQVSGSETVDLSDKAALQKIFGGAQSLALSAGATKKESGLDALVTINGVDVSRSSNTFTVDGITMQLTQVSAKNDDNTYEAATVTTSQNSDSIVDTLKAFVKDYNALVDKFQGLISEDAEYQKYAPLTDDQEKEMSDSEIEKWTAKAKTGLLRNDDTLESFLTNMRNALYTKSSSSNLALYDIGISTYDKTGKLEIDETALRNALASDPEGVSNLFTDSTDGLSKKLMQVMDDTAKVSSGSPGLLVTMAGTKDLATSLTSNTLYKQMVELDNKIDQLKDRYENEKDRYWSMFNAMETAMSNFNSQSTMLSSYFSS